MTRRRWLAVCHAAAACLALAPGSAAAQSAYFSATGTFSLSSGQSHDFHFDIPSTSSMLFRTWAWGGGTNAAGQVIPPGGIDSILALYNSANTEIGYNDDIGPGQRDSRIIVPALLAGSYRLELTNFEIVVGNGAWAVDLVNNSGDLTLTAALGSANSTMHTLAFGGADGGIAKLPIDAGTSATITSGLHMNSGGFVNVAGAGTVTFAGAVNAGSGSGLIVPTAVTARFGGAVTGLGALSGGGIKIFQGAAAGGPLATGGSTVVAAGATLVADHIRESSLTIDGSVAINPNGTGAGTSRVNALLLAGTSGNWSGELDLANNGMVIDYSAGSSPLPVVLDQIRFAASGAATGGIRASGGAGYAIGYAEASALSTIPPLFGLVDDDALLVRGTRLGDANLDGTVSLPDFNRLAANFGASNAFWHQGDFNYDGMVNLQDFNRLAGQFGLSASPGSPTPQDWAALASAVPEPAMGLAAAGMSLLRRKRRRR